VDAGLVDELNLTIVPVFVASGAPLFRDDGESRSWELVEVGPGDDPGLVRLSYRPVAEQSAGRALGGLAQDEDDLQ
jgi:dihydrofolate reductase